VKALIAGGGIAGLATGIALRQAGFDVEIFERAPERREIGAGLMIWPNGARSLEALGFEADALPIETLSICSQRGRPLSHYPLRPIAQSFRFQPCFVHRADLQSALACRFGSDHLHFGADVAGFKGPPMGSRRSYATAVQPAATF
jgi:FAD-dependent urate hydroxylase